MSLPGNHSPSVRGYGQHWHSVRYRNTSGSALRKGAGRDIRCEFRAPHTDVRYHPRFLTCQKRRYPVGAGETTGTQGKYRPYGSDNGGGGSRNVAPSNYCMGTFSPYNTRGFKKFGGSVGPDTDEEGYLPSLVDTKKRVKAVEALIVSFCQVSARWVCLPNLRRRKEGASFAKK